MTFYKIFCRIWIFCILFVSLLLGCNSKNTSKSSDSGSEQSFIAPGHLLSSAIPELESAVGETASHVITVYNVGDSIATELAFAPLPPELPISIDKDSCTNATLNQRNPCVFTIVFAPKYPTSSGVQDLILTYKNTNGEPQIPLVMEIKYQTLVQKPQLIFKDITGLSSKLNETSIETFKVKNNSSMNVNNLDFTNLKEPLQISQNHCRILAPQEECNFSISFSPTSSTPEKSEQTLELKFRYGQGISESIHTKISYIVLKGETQPNLTISPLTPFKTAVDQSGFQTLTVTNEGADTASNLSIKIEGNVLTPLFIENNTCVNEPLKQNEICTFQLRFSPIEPVPIETSDTLKIYYNDSTGNAQNPFTTRVFYSTPGGSEPPPTPEDVLSIEPLQPMTAFMFSNVEQTIKVKNIGYTPTKPLVVEKLSPPLFIVENNCSARELETNESCTLRIKLMSRERSSGTGAITIKYSNDNPSAVSHFPYEVIQADGEDRLKFTKMNPTMYAKVNQPVTQTVIVKNLSQDAIVLSQDSFIPLPDNSPLEISGNTCTNTLPSQKECEFNLIFKPEKQISLTSDLIAIRYNNVTLSQYVSYTTHDNESLPDEIQTETLRVWNKCDEPIWMQSEVATAAPDDLHKIVKIERGQFHDYHIPDSGVASLNLWPKFKCNSSGNLCQVGQSVGSIGECSREYGCQPAINTAFESTFGCVLKGEERAHCAKNPSSTSGDLLIPASFFDLTLVNGYTVPMFLHIIPAQNEPNSECHTMSTPNFEMGEYNGCPKNENLSAQSEDWDVNKHPDNWKFKTISDNAANQIVNPFWGLDLQTAIVHIGETAWNKGVESLKENSRVSVESPLKCLDAKKQLKDTTINLSSVDLRIKNPETGEYIGCASPKSMMSADRFWNGLGIGNQCVEERDGDAPKAPPYPDYLDPNLFYSNPYSNEILAIVPGPGTEILERNSQFGTWNKRWKNLVEFCAANHDFCFCPSGQPGCEPSQPRGGLAAIVGHAGAIGNSKYVQSIKEINPNIYTWQYDDAAGTRVCERSPKIVLSICSAN